MSDTFDGSVVEYFDVDLEIAKMQVEERIDEDDNSDEDIDWSRMENDDYHHYSGDNSSC